MCRFVLMTCGKKAFTLIELLVVISIIALLLSILMPALGRAREQARIVVCANNEKQIGTSLLMYAFENDDLFPLHIHQPWLHDITYTTSDYIIKTGGDKKTFYCPSDLQHRTWEDPRFWKFTQAYNDDYGPEPTNRALRDVNYRVTGYFFLMDNVVARTYLPRTVSGEPPKMWLRKASIKMRNSEFEMVTDSVYSNGTDRYTTNFVNVTSSAQQIKWNLLDNTNHLISNTIPAGGNIVFLDGHVEWRPFVMMEWRVGPPYHWW